MKEKNLKKSELSLFCYQLSLILKSGLPLVEAMEMMETETTDSRMNLIVREMSEDIRQGSGIYEAIAKHSGFPKYFLGMVEIAQQTGNLQEELERLSKYYEDSEKMSQRIRNAVTYPLILLFMMTLVILFLILKVLPMFHDILRSIGGAVPESTKTIIAIGTGLQRYFGMIFGGIVAVVVGLVLYFRTQTGRLKWSQFTLQLPYLRSLYQKMISARFSKSMTMLMKGGISFDDSIGMIISAMDNPHVEQQLNKAREEIVSGTEVMDAFDKINVFPPLFLKLMKVGHKTGEMEKTMEKLAGIYEIETERSLNRITSSIEPTLVIILSLVVGIILLTVMIPLINIISNIG